MVAFMGMSAFTNNDSMFDPDAGRCIGEQCERLSGLHCKDFSNVTAA